MTNKEKQAILEKEIDLIQGCINRMAQNSFIIKGWLITLIAVILGLLPEKFDVKIICLIICLITICFWYLDAFFLKTERLYRWKYEWVIKNRYESKEFYYDLNPYNEKMWLDNIDGTKKSEPGILNEMFSKTLRPMYIPIAIVVAIILLINI